MNVSRPALRLAAVLAAFVLLPGAKGGCGSKESNETLASPVQALGLLLERPDGAVGARLVVISTHDRDVRFVDGATSPVVRMGTDAPIGLTAAESGHYVVDSARAPGLKYSPGATYQFRFGLDDPEVAGDNAGAGFVGVIDAPDDEVSFEFTEAPAVAGDLAKVRWAPAERWALLTVRDAEGDVTYTTFDLSHPEFDGSKWGRLKKGGDLELGVDVFPAAGTYTVSLCAVERVSDFDTALSSSLGALSGLLAGRCAPDQTVTVQ